MTESLVDLFQSLEAVKSIKEMNEVSNKIADIGEPAVLYLLQYAKPPRFSAGSDIIVMRILQKIGYPGNRAALTYIVSHASDINSTAWEVAMDILVSIGEPAMSEVHEALQFYSRKPFSYRFEIQGLTTLLEKMGSPLIDPLLPDLLVLLRVGTDRNEVGEYAISPIRMIGSPKADKALKYLGKIISSQCKKRIRKLSIEALSDFDPEAVRPLVPVLQDCLSDQDDEIRQCAENILKVLGE